MYSVLHVTTCTMYNVHTCTLYLNRIVQGIVDILLHLRCVRCTLRKLSNSKWWSRHVVVVIVSPAIFSQGPTFTCPRVGIDGCTSDGVDLSCPASWSHPLMSLNVCVYVCLCYVQCLCVWQVMHTYCKLTSIQIRVWINSTPLKMQLLNECKRAWCTLHIAHITCMYIYTQHL